MKFERIAITILLTPFIVTTCMLFGLESQIRAQGTLAEGGRNIPAHLLHTFESEEGDLLAIGQFVQLDGATISIRFADHSLGKIKLNEVSDEDRKWVKRQISIKKKQEKQAAEAKKIFSTINATKPRTVVSGCSKLKPIGRAASGLESSLITVLANADDERAKLACLSLFPRICKLEWGAIVRVNSLLNRNKYDSYDLVLSKPKQFLSSIATLDYIGLPFLQHVANRCTLKTESDWLDTLNDPINIKFAEGSESKLRNAAIKAIGEVKSEEAALILVDLAPAIEEQHKGKKGDHLETLIVSLGKIGFEHDEVIELLERHLESFPKSATKSLKQVRGE